MILTLHGPKLKPHQNLPALLAVQKSLTRKYDQLSKLLVASLLPALKMSHNFFKFRCDFNKYTMQYISRLGSAYASSQAKMETDKVVEDLEGGSGSDLEEEV